MVDKDDLFDEDEELDPAAIILEEDDDELEDDDLGLEDEEDDELDEDDLDPKHLSSLGFGIEEEDF